MAVGHRQDDGANGYEARSDTFLAARARSNVGARQVRAWARALRPEAEVLDLGCGNGVPITSTLLEEGCAVWGVDASPSLVAAFRARFPDSPVECARAEESRLFSRSFHAVVAWGLIFLLDPATQERLLRRIPTALHPGGKLLFTAPADSCEWTDILTDRPSRSLGVQRYEEILASEGLRITDLLTDESANHYYLAELQT